MLSKVHGIILDYLSRFLVSSSAHAHPNTIPSYFYTSREERSTGDAAPAVTFAVGLVSYRKPWLMSPDSTEPKSGQAKPEGE
jgi:hypothetical protein